MPAHLCCPVHPVCTASLPAPTSIQLNLKFDFDTSVSYGSNRQLAGSARNIQTGRYCFVCSQADTVLYVSRSRHSNSTCRLTGTQQNQRTSSCSWPLCDSQGPALAAAPVTAADHSTRLAAPPLPCSKTRIQFCKLSVSCSSIENGEFAKTGSRREYETEIDAETACMSSHHSRVYSFQDCRGLDLFAGLNETSLRNKRRRV